MQTHYATIFIRSFMPLFDVARHYSLEQQQECEVDYETWSTAFAGSNFHVFIEKQTMKTFNPSG